MKEWSCSNIVPECKWRYQGESEDEILVNASKHARDSHGMEEVPPEIVDRIRATIVEVS